MTDPLHLTGSRVGLTGRGVVFLVSGLVVGLLGLLAGLVPMVQFGVLLAVLPLVAAVLTRRPGRGLAVHRILSARELASGQVLTVTISVEGRFPRAQSLLLEDLAPSSLGGDHHLAVSGLSGRAISRPNYRIRVGARGAHQLGPLRIHVVDRFGLVHRVTTVGGHSEVLVVPRVVALDPMVLGGATIGSGSGRLGSAGGAADDVIPRPYAQGDELRRVDWKASARIGELMVRSEERPWRSALTVLVDMRAADHRGDEPDSSLDTALTLAASIGVLALDTGWDLTVATTDGLEVFTGSPLTGVAAERRALLRGLAVLPVSHTSVPALAVARNPATFSGPVVLIAGAVPVPTAGLLAGIAVHSPRRMLMAVRAEQWRPSAASTPQSPAARAEAEQSVDLFRGAGWTAVEVGRHVDLATVWPVLAGQP